MAVKLDDVDRTPLRFDPTPHRKTALPPDHAGVDNTPPRSDSESLRVLRELRHLRRLSLDEVANRAGVSRSQLSRIERGFATASPEVITRLVEAIGADESAL